MLILGLSVQSVSGICTYFPLWPFWIVKFVSDVVVGSLWSLFTVAVYNCHLFRYKLLGLCVTSGCSEWEMRSRWLFALVHVAKGWVDLSVREFDEILVGVYFLFFLLFLWRFGVCHCLIIYVTLYFILLYFPRKPSLQEKCVPFLL